MDHGYLSTVYCLLYFLVLRVAAKVVARKGGRQLPQGANQISFRPLNHAPDVCNNRSMLVRFRRFGLS